MQKRTYLFFLIGLLFCGLLVIGLWRTSESIHQQQFYVFGTLVNVSIWGVDELKANEAITVIAHDFQTMHHRWHAWHPSDLTALNQAIASGKTSIVTDLSLLSLLKNAKLFYTNSHGLFNPAIGQLINLWGFQSEDFDTQRPLPLTDKIAQLVALAPTMDDVEVNGDQISSHNQAVQLDFGAFAKGYAVDLAIEKLRQLGIQHAIINAGGNLKAMGQKGENPWLIGIRHPSGQGVLAAVTVSGEESVITSGDYERFREYNGVRYSHIIDPRNGKPVQSFTSVTVIDQRGILADAASTALMVAGLSDWHRIAQQMGIKYAMLVDDSGTIYLNPAMKARVVFPTEKLPKMIVSEPL